VPAGDLVKSPAQLPDLSDPFRPVHTSAPLTPYDVERIERVIRHAGASAGLQFSVFIGTAEEDARAYATRLHRALDDPDHSVLILVDPPGKLLEIVTGTEARRVLGDAECQLAAATMQSSFVANDLAGGLTAGIQQLGSSAYQAPTLHLEQNS
jgi:uncharacterized membrane protein YgcG